MVSKSTLSAIINFTAGTTIPVVVDDVANMHAMEELSVQFMGGVSYSTVATGKSKPRTGIIVTSTKISLTQIGNKNNNACIY